MYFKSIFLICFSSFLVLVNAENIPGVVQLNTGTFDKVIEKFHTAFVKFDKKPTHGSEQRKVLREVAEAGDFQKQFILCFVPIQGTQIPKIISRIEVVLVKFDETYPYGDKQDTFKEVVNGALSQDKLLMAEVHVADYGEKENHELAERFDLSKESFPAYLLFISGQKEPVKFTGDVKSADAIKRFIVQESGLWLGLPACIEEFDKLVKEFFDAKSDTEMKAVVERAQTEAATREGEEKERADIYVKYMEKILEKGEEFVSGELQRVEKLQTGKVSDKKKQQLKDRASILTSFSMRLKDEL